MSEGSLLLRHACVVTAQSEDPQNPLGVIPDGSVAILGDRIAWVGPSSAWSGRAEDTMDLEGRALLPGLVDPHTHLVFAGSRVDEFSRRLAGEDYRDIAREGGGIAATVAATRASDEQALYESARARLVSLRRGGVTTCEVKSGYGLTLASECRLLRVARRLAAEGVAQISTTFLGAHVVPPERAGDRRAYVDEIVDEMLPTVAREGLADACDVYIDEGAFDLEEARRILTAARRFGLALKAHVGQFRDLGGPSLLAELGATSADHLEAVSDAGLCAMAEANVRAVLLPGAWTTLRQRPPDIARMRSFGVRMAVGTDLNPGTSPVTDLLLCASLAARAGLSAEEALLGVTSEAASAIGVQDRGRIAPGARADLAVFDVLDPRALVYALGGCRASRVLLGGRWVHQEPFEGPLFG